VVTFDVRYDHRPVAIELVIGEEIQLGVTPLGRQQRPDRARCLVGAEAGLHDG
jgi:hypothetical protein